MSLAKLQDTMKIQRLVLFLCRSNEQSETENIFLKIP